MNEAPRDADLSHPAADRATTEALVVEQSRAVVGLSSWVADAAVVATATGRLMQLVTPADSRITFPLELLFGDGGGQWIVRGAEGQGLWDGFTGVPMAWDGRRYVPVDGTIPEPDIGMNPAAGSLDVQISTLHPATAELRVGTSAAAVALALTGRPPLGWGTAEPATQPWSVDQLTEMCRERAPDPTALVVVAGEPGRRMVGRIRVSRVTAGVLEEVRIAGPAARAVAQDAIDELVEDVAATARSMVVAVHPLRSEGTRPSRPSPPPVPYGILIGSSVVNAHGVDHARKAPASAVRVLGRRSGDPACWCRLSGGAMGPFEQLGAVLRHFDLTDQPR